MEAKDFRPVHTGVESVILDGDRVLRVVKTEKQMEFDTNSYARLVGEDFHNGTLRVKVRSRLLSDAPDLARGFIGLAFRINESDSEFECFYVRPTNGKSCVDPVRRAHGCQYFAFPGYTFAHFREFGIGGYEAPCDIDLNEWIDLKIKLEGPRGRFYVNNMATPALVVENMKHGDSRGGIGLFVDIGTEGFFKDLEFEREQSR